MSEAVGAGRAAAPRPLMGIPDEIAYFDCATMAPSLTAAREAAQTLRRAGSSGSRLWCGRFRVDRRAGVSFVAQLERHDGDVDVVEVAEHPD